MYTLVQNRSGHLIERPGKRNLYKLIVRDSSFAADLTTALKGDSGVIHANQNGMSAPAYYSPDDYYWYLQWPLLNTGQSPSGVAGADIRILPVWQKEFGSSSQWIGMIDDGIYSGHSDLQGRVYGEELTSNSHGVMVAGIIAANHNSIGIAGVNPQAKILCFNADAHGWDDEALAQWILDFADNDFEIVNHSWGMSGNSWRIQDAIVYAYNSGGLAVVSAGNQEGGNEYLADLTGVFTVAAVTNNNEKATYSHISNFVDIAAPSGPELNGDWDRAIFTTYAPNSYASFTGTSAAAPFVTGVASLLKNHFPDLTNDDLAEVMKRTARDVNYEEYPGWDPRLGAGFLDADSAFRLLSAPQTLVQSSSGTPYDYSTSQRYVAAFLSTGSLPAGVYEVERHEVRASVTYPVSFMSVAGVWGRGASSSGYPYENPIYGFHNCEVVPGSESLSGCELRTFVYDVWTLGGGHLGYRPVAPGSVHLEYSVVGEQYLDPCASLSATADLEKDTLFLTWPDPNTNEEGFVLQRRAGNGQWADLQMLDENVTSFQEIILDWSQFPLSESRLTGSETFSYRVRPFTRNQQVVNHSPEAVFTSRPVSPTNVEANPVYENGEMTARVAVSWQVPQNQKSGSIDHYKIQVKYLDYSPYRIFWLDNVTGTDLEFCSNFSDAHMIITVYTVDIFGQISRNTWQNDDYTWCGHVGWENCAASIREPEEKQALAVEETIRCTDSITSFPNPFNASTQFSLSLALGGRTELEVINVLGQVVAKLDLGNLYRGTHTIVWNGHSIGGDELSSGIYFATFKVEGVRIGNVHKLLLIK